ncbi:hypothetical protein DBV14_12920 [Variovorax sp. KBW07]|uniref:methionyl-tRNA formyltransferase n=1 Tax=Variovorax sp. KBW07 TaxID=2153358 RepID=UPI000F56D092|nr:methionyl-tRNA formyltransferase [Variovorax sp. KBW07]RQO54544.1 hypothetical protein DBV14_12920 [Variovorax sp. KBW07]
MDAFGIVTRAVFIGSKSLGLAIFECLYAETPGLQWTVVHPDDRSDARSNLGDFSAFASKHGIEFFVPSTPIEAREMLAAIKPDIGLVCGWYWLLDAATLDSIPRGLWGMHNSLLPKYRGNAPLVWSIINGDKTVGSTVFRLAEGMDSGEVLCQVELQLGESDTVGEVLEAIQRALVQELPARWTALLAGRAELSTQDESMATYCGSRQEADGLVSWGKTASEIHDFIRAQAPPYPAAFSFLRSQKVRLLRSSVFRGTYFGTPGQVLRRLDESVLVACGGNTAIELLRVSTDSCGESVTVTQILGSMKDRFSDSPIMELWPSR